MKYKSAILIIFFGAGVNSLAQLPFDQAHICGLDNTRTMEQLQVVSSISQAKQQNGLQSSDVCLGRTNLGAGDTWYTATQDYLLYSINTRTSQLQNIGSYIAPDLCENKSECNQLIKLGLLKELHSGPVVELLD